MEVDLEYPSEISDSNNDYLLAPEVMEIKTEMLIKTHLQIRRKYYVRCRHSVQPEALVFVFIETKVRHLQRKPKIVFGSGNKGLDKLQPHHVFDV